jgi:uroporphyrinogen-III synthase
LQAKLVASGFDVLDCAMTAIEPAAQAELAHAQQLIEAADAVVLVSPQAAKAALVNMADAMRSKPIAVMGPGSRTALESAGMAPAQIIESGSQDGLGLVDDLLGRLSRGACVAIGRARSGREDLARALSAGGLMVNFATLYHRADLPWSSTTAAQLFDAAKQDLRVLFTTSSAPLEFVNRLKAAETVGPVCVGATQALLLHATAFCTHPNVTDAATKAGFGRAITQMGDESSWLASLQSVHV